MVFKQIEFVLEEKSLSRDEARKVLLDMISKNVPDTTKAAFLSALYVKGETADEISGFADALKSMAKLSKIPGVTDIVGTGGDGKNTINVSTASSIVASSLGVNVAKHGNVGITSKHGSADFMKYLGYDFDLTQSDAMKRLTINRYVYIFAPLYNDNFAKFANVRKKLKFRTVFNFLGPLTNPLDPDTVIIGSVDENISKIYADVLLTQNKKGMVIHSLDGMDEISPMEKTMIYEVDGKVSKYLFSPDKLLSIDISLEDISTLDSGKNFKMTLEGLKGVNRKVAQFIALNTAPALYMNGIAKGLDDAFYIALNALEDGTAIGHLKQILNNSAGVEVAN